jgi:DNA-binding transcriptional LysR family regulator
MADISSLDLNLLRLFEAIYRHRNISRAANELGMSQPATSQGLMRLRLAIKDPLFERTAGGVRPTERAHRLARAVQPAMALLQTGVQDEEKFDPRTSTGQIKLHLTDIGEARFLPQLMNAVQARAPNVQIFAAPWPVDQIAPALHSGELNFAIGFLPPIDGAAQCELLTDRYELVLRSNHPFLRAARTRAAMRQRLAELEFVAVRSHGQTLRMLEALKLQHRVRLIASSFLALPEVVRSSNLAVLMPRQIAQRFQPADAFTLIDPGVPRADFRVALHWSRRHERTGLNRWCLALLRELFAEA